MATGGRSASETEHDESTSTCASSSYFAEDTSDTDDGDLSAKPKKAKYACSFHPESNKFRWAKVSKKGPSFALCTICSRDVSVAYGGIKDLKRHELTEVHQSASRSVKATHSLTSYFHNTSGPKRDEAVVEAEVKFVFFSW